MWQIVLPPIMVVVFIWVSISLGTNFYLRWLEWTYQTVQAENLASIDASEDLRESLKLLMHVRAGGDEAVVELRSKVIDAIFDQTFDCIGRLRNSSHTKEEAELLAKIMGQIESLRGASLDRVRTINTPEEIAEESRRWHELLSESDWHAEKISAINQKIRDQVEARRNWFGNIVQFVRLMFLALGPILGVWLGRRLSRRLQDSVTQVAITLQSSDSPELELGTVMVKGNGILGDLQNEAKNIIARLREAYRELESARNEVARSERLAAVGALAAGVAHELRNPMTSVKLLLQHLNNQSAPHMIGDEQMRTILAQISRMESTIQGLLDFSRDNPLNKEEIDVNLLVRRAMNLVEGRQRQSQVRVNMLLSERALPIYGDGEQLLQVIVNLLINAFDSMPHGGGLLVRTEADTENASVRIVIQDDGIGIPEEILPRLFEPFVTSKDRGTGLGLAVSRRIIHQHHGRVSGVNNAGGGATFTIELNSLAKSQVAQHR